VLRDGQWIELPRREIVPGDVVRLSAGDVVPGDATLIESKDLHVQQAVLTGESMPVEKEPSKEATTTPTSIDRENRVFLGTSVVSGTATALVEATGASTEFGKIAGRLAIRAPETEFEAGMRRFGFLILRVVMFLVLFVFLVNVVLHRDPLESVLFSLALAVGLTPEFLPMIVAVTLSRGAVRMARQKVVVKHLAAMQNLGSMDVLCSDKTGTLTCGSVVLEQVLDPLGAPSDRAMLFARLNSRFETGIRSPLDTAILDHPYSEIEGYHKVDEIPFDFNRRRLSVVVDGPGERWLVTKGAPETVLPSCATYEVAGRTSPLEDDAERECQAVYRRLSRDGLRVLAVAYRKVEPQAAYHASDETQLILAGYLTFADPPRADASDTLTALRRDGVRVKILTGDNEVVARHVCLQVGLDASRIIIGSELESISDVALGAIADETDVFARLSPIQKHRVILALKHRGHVVGFLGDGINDVPSLHAADVGISVATAADVAKDTAEIILLECDLGVLHAGIAEGRRAFGNVMKYLLMGTSSNFGNMFSMAGASLFLPFLPMLPTQILLNNFLYDMSQLTIPTDNVDESLTYKPRRWNIRLIRDFMFCVGPVSSLFDMLTFGVLILALHASEPMFHTGWFVESLATQTLVILVIRTAGNPFRSRPSFPLIASVTLVVLAGLLLPYTPWGDRLGFVPLPAGYLAFLATVIGTYLFMVDLVKRVLLRRWLVTLRA
jgi:P-type Mg2+ transporter